jgi:hypothetical protein
MRRSRRLRELQLKSKNSQNEAQPRASSSTSSGSPSKVSKLKSRVRMRRGGSQHTWSESHVCSPQFFGVQDDPNAGPSMPLSPADWEIAPGRIRVGTGGSANSKISSEIDRITQI